MQPLPRALALLFLVFAILGFTDAAFLTAKHYMGGPLPCFSGGTCETVTNSPYAVVLGIPVALLGAIYYLSLIILLILYWDTKNTLWIQLAARLTIVGLLASIYLVSLQLFVIHAICIYCMASATSSTLLFIFGIAIQHRLKTPLQPSN